MKSIQPRKQHKMLYQAPLHVRYRHFAAPLSPTLKASYLVNSVPVRTGDTVRIMRGDRKGSEGKVTKVDRQKYRIFVEGITREKVDGTAVQVPIHPSKVMITSLNMDDKWRKESLKVEVPREAEKKEKPKEEKKPRKKRKPRKAPAEKAKNTRKRKKTPTEEKEGEMKVG